MNNKRRGAYPASFCVVHNDDQVTVCGECLHPVIWQGRQWAVTTYGVECRDGCYAFEAGRLCEDHADGYSWIKHMAEKEWVDMADFATAFFVAVALHGVKLTRKEIDMLANHYHERQI
jgi:hypothetical protein